jgi:hypothetical protein
LSSLITYWIKSSAKSILSFKSLKQPLAQSSKTQQGDGSIEFRL